MISSISSFDIINASSPFPELFLRVLPSAADATALNDNGIKTLLPNGLSILLIKGKSVFSNGLRILPRNPPDGTILVSQVFDNFILADQLFTKALLKLETCLAVNNGSFGKLVLSLEPRTIFDDRFRADSVVFFIPDFNLLSSEVDSFPFKLLY